METPHVYLEVATPPVYAEVSGEVLEEPWELWEPYEWEEAV